MSVGHAPFRYASLHFTSHTRRKPRSICRSANARLFEISCVGGTLRGFVRTFDCMIFARLKIIRLLKCVDSKRLQAAQGRF